MAPANTNRTQKPYSRPAARPRASDGQWLHDKAPGVPRAVQATAPARPATGVTNTRIIVSNLHYEITPKDLTQIFGQIGTLVREPQIRYDRSGRSLGVAVITFETPAEATRAKKQFDGILAKNQPMSIAYDNSPPPAPRGPRRSASTPSLLNRIEKPSLIERLSRDEPKPKKQEVVSDGGVGPVRTKGRQVRRKKQPKTAEQLDKELDSFMKDEVSPAQGQPASGGAAGDGDVEMA
ncbi:RNA-binding domain-containing protein [Cubamyces menziesii]|nr:RNA-binding domain-containing protein [Cubamyces menziesii]